MTTPTPLRPDQAPEAAGYVRVSTRLQGQGYSPEVQREAIKRVAAEQGYTLLPDHIYEDHERGSKITRAGYQHIIAGVRAGTVHAVIVYHFDRFGRDGGEWITRAREFERLGVPIISVQEGQDQPGMMRFVRAGMAEEYSRQLASRVKPSRERAARSGTHMGCTPLGYKRVYPASEASGRRPPAELVPDEATAWLVREIYERYAGGGYSLRTLAHWLNSDPRVAGTRKGAPWRNTPLRWILTNPTYKGCVRYNHHSEGLFARAAPDEVFVTAGRHEALVSEETWNEVQRRLRAAAGQHTHNLTRTHAGHPIALGSGIMACVQCGSHLSLHRGGPLGETDMYICIGRRTGNAECHMRSFSAPVGDTALLAEIRRLRGAPWTLQRETRLLGPDVAVQVQTAATTARALEAERERLRKNVRRMTDLADDPGPEEIAAYRQVQAEISTRIRSLEAQIAAQDARAAAVPDLRRLHAQLTQGEWRVVIDDLASQGNREELRAIVVGLLASARLVEVRPLKHPTWARMEVTWTPQVQMLLGAGLLWLDEPDEGPRVLSSVELRRARERRKRAKKRAARLQEQGQELDPV